MEENNKKYEKGTIGWLKEQARKDGFDNLKDWNEWKKKKNEKTLKYHPCSKAFQEKIKEVGMTGNQYIQKLIEEGKLKSPTYIDNEWAKKRGHKNYVDYQTHLAQEKGFEDLNDRRYYLAREKGFVNINDYQNHLAQKKGFRNRAEYDNHLAKKNGFKNKYDEFLSKRGFKDSKEYRDSLAQDRGFEDNKEYRDSISQEHGYKNFSEYRKMSRWDKGDCSPMYENKDCSIYLGIHIVEKKIAKTVLEMIFDYVEEMPPNNPGFDFKCKDPVQEFISKYPQFRLERDKEYKIDSKSATVDSLDKLQFAIRYNNIPDYFLSTGFNNRDNLDISGMWLIKSDEQIRINRDPLSKVDFWNRKTFTITNRPEYILKFQQYELTDKLLLEGHLRKIRDEILNGTNID